MRWTSIGSGNSSRGERRLLVTPLGGLGEIGKNMMAIEYGGEMILVDAGLAFPEDDLPGIDIVIPDMSYVFERREKLRALLLTHGHEDHIGAVPYLLREAQVPVLGTRLTLGLVQRKIRQDGLELPPGSHAFTPGAEPLQVGPFRIEPFRVNHSVPDAVGFIIRTPVGTLVHTGDFKFDYTPVDGQVADLHALARAGEDGVLCLFADSTNVERNGFTPSERLVGQAIASVVQGAERRVIVATFASNVHRIQQVFDVAAAVGRKVAVVGRSMVDTVDVAQDLGYLTFQPGTYVEVDEAGRLPPERVVLLTTGSQGEPLSALVRISAGEHRTVSLQPGDTVVIAATPVPGNEKMVHRTIDNLTRLGAHVVTPGDGVQVHVSGHGSREELKLMHRLLHPAYFVPIHGEARHLARHAELARDLGMPANHVLIGSNGTQFELSPRGVRIVGQVAAGRVLVDGLGVGDVGNAVLRDRRQLAQDGIVVVQVAVRREAGEIVGSPEIISRGFVYTRGSEALLDEARARVSAALGDAVAARRTDAGALRAAIRDSLAQFLYGKTGRRPMILPLVAEV